MLKPRLFPEQIYEIKKLRSHGLSINEITSIVGKGKTTVSRYIQGVPILAEYQSVLKEKQGGSRARMRKYWRNNAERADQIIGEISSRDQLMLLIGVYWGEGTKHDLCIINGDPLLLRLFIVAVVQIGVSKDRIVAHLRLYEDIDVEKALLHWAKILDLDRSQFKSINILKGKEKGKLEFGMCRLRAQKPSQEFKLLISCLNVIKEQVSRRSSTDRTRDS